MQAESKKLLTIELTTKIFSNTPPISAIIVIYKKPMEKAIPTQDQKQDLVNWKALKNPSKIFIPSHVTDINQIFKTLNKKHKTITDAIIIPAKANNANCQERAYINGKIKRNRI